ncbi:hypothetical protein BAU15_07665 [Enterococcus sp. JM4C]|uniref:PF20097 family protein n=1 Tax=Candidatus Enterococcus huntleyi TaxID=1857217 RepID=UPI00137B2EB3|nr:PF20097 family protein [Enterococcus sp. JM4C]KAF1297580.1 hypothetical protein BAU15_07665 [Enterococcus sp. JM4C]
MKCAKCETEMIKGAIQGDRYALKWAPAKGSSAPYITLKRNSLLGRTNTEAFHCRNCETLTIDLKSQQA